MVHFLIASSVVHSNMKTNFWAFEDSSFVVGGESIPHEHAHHVHHVHLSLSPSPYSRTLRETLRTHCITLYVHHVSRVSRIVYTRIQYVSTQTCPPRFATLLRKAKFICISHFPCYRRSELLGCMTLPLPLSQDKVNIAKLGVSIRDTRSRGFRPRFASSVSYYGIHLETSAKVCCYINIGSGVSAKFLCYKSLKSSSFPGERH